MSIIATIPVLHFIGTDWNDVTVERAEYADGSTALLLMCDRDRLTTATVFIKGETPAEGCVFIKDYSECAGLCALLEQAGVLKATGRVMPLGDYGATALEALIVATEPESEPEVEVPVTWWVLIEHGDHSHTAVGPYESEEAAGVSEADGLIVQGIIEEDAVDLGSVQGRFGVEPNPAHITMRDVIVLTDRATGLTLDEARFEAHNIDVGTPEVVTEGDGHGSCEWHAYDRNGYSVDGGTAQMIIDGNSHDGNYPDQVTRVCKVIVNKA